MILKNILFVCSANKQRSKTAEDYFAEKFPEINFHSGGTNKKICRKEGTNFITEDDLIWANSVYVMESKHKKQINEHTDHRYNSKMIILDIPDRFKYYQNELLKLLDDKLQF